MTDSTIISAAIPIATPAIDMLVIKDKPKRLRRDTRLRQATQIRNCDPEPEFCSVKNRPFTSSVGHIMLLSKNFSMQLSRVSKRSQTLSWANAKGLGPCILDQARKAAPSCLIFSHPLHAGRLSAAHTAPFLAGNGIF